MINQKLAETILNLDAEDVESLLDHLETEHSEVYSEIKEIIDEVAI